MGKGISGKTPLWKRRLPAEVVANGAALIAAGVTTAGLILKRDDGLATASAIGFVCLLCACVWKLWQANKHDAEADSYEGIWAALLVLHAAVCQMCGVTEDRSQHLRITLHRVVDPIDAPTQIEQLVNYVGGKGNGAGRRFPVHCGITGQAVRARSPAVASLVNDDADAVLAELIQHWGYTEEQARRLTSRRPALMAVPILADDGQVALGVVYLDSDVKDLFSAAEVREAIVTACSGLTTFIHRRYR